MFCLLLLFIARGERIQIALKAGHHRTDDGWFGSFVISQAIRASIATCKTPYIFVIFQRAGCPPPPPSPPLNHYLPGNAKVTCLKVHLNVYDASQMMIQMSYTLPWQLKWHEWNQSGSSGSRTTPLENHKICVDILVRLTLEKQ